MQCLRRELRKLRRGWDVGRSVGWVEPAVRHNYQARYKSFVCHVTLRGTRVCCADCNVKNENSYFREHSLRRGRSGKVILLGTGTSVGVPMVGCHCAVCTSDDPRNSRTRTGVVVEAPEGNLLIDTSPELRLQLVRERIEMIDAVLFTHSHADHLFGLDDLRIFGLYTNRATPLYCEENVERQIRTSFGYAFAPPDPHAHRGATPLLRFERIGVEPFNLLGLAVRPIRLIHGRLPILGFRFRDFAFCTDVSHIPDESWPLMEGLDVLVISALREKPHPAHFNVEQALEAVRRLRPKRTYLTHISHHLEHEATNRRLPPGVALAYDGLRFDF